MGADIGQRSELAVEIADLNTFACDVSCHIIARLRKLVQPRDGVPCSREQFFFSIGSFCVPVLGWIEQMWQSRFAFVHATSFLAEGLTLDARWQSGLPPLSMLFGSLQHSGSDCHRHRGAKSQR